MFAMQAQPLIALFCGALAFATLGLVPSAEAAATAAYGPVDISLEPLLAGRWAGFIREGDLFVTPPVGSEPVLVRKKPEGGLIFSPQLESSGGRLWAAWIERSPNGNRLFSVATTDNASFPPEPTPVADSVPSTQLRLTTGGGGTVAMIDGTTVGKAELFLSLSRDGGGHFERKAIAVDHFDQLHQVAAVIDNDRVLTVVHGQKDESPVIALIRNSLDSQELGLTERVTQAALTPLLALVPLGAQPAVLFKDTEAGKPNLKVATKKDQEWSVGMVSGTANLDVARLDQTSWPDARILVVFSGEHRDQDKQRVFASVSKDAGQTWSTVQIDSARFENTRAWLPRLARDGDKVVVVWEDSRNIRARIRMQFSGDRGDTWLPHDVTLSDPAYHGLRPRISADAEGITVAWHQYRTDARHEADLVLRRLQWSELSELVQQEVPPADEEPGKEQLLESVNRYWRAMVENDLRTSYETHDPFYRAKVPFMQYAARRGPMAYHSFRVETTEIRGNEAAVTLSVNYSVPRITMFGETRSLPARDFPIVETWLRVDGIWARKFVDAMSGGSAINY